LGTYLDSRFEQTALLKENFSRGTINLHDDLNYGLTTAELWPDMIELKKKILITPNNAETNAETIIMAEFLDIVGVHTYTDGVAV